MCYSLVHGRQDRRLQFETFKSQALGDAPIAPLTISHNLAEAMSSIAGAIHYG